MATPYIAIDLSVIENNARAIVDYCRRRSVTVTGVTKGVCAYPPIARAMLRGGVASLADSRLENIRRLRRAGIQSPFMMLRLPPLSAARDIALETDLSLNSELQTLEALSRAAVRAGIRHDVLLMLDLGDRREGICPEDLLPFARRALKLPGIRVRGTAANFACFGGLVPDEDNLNLLVRASTELKNNFPIELDWISGLNSSGLDILASGRLPAGVNPARLGESILLGRETLRRDPWPGTRQDAFVVYAEILELKNKPPGPSGERGEDAFGERHDFDDPAGGPRALLNIGREDIDERGLRPLDERLRVIGATSGYLLLDVRRAPGVYKVGDEIGFYPNYSALLRAMTSAYVSKRPRELEAGAKYSDSRDNNE